MNEILEEIRRGIFSGNAQDTMEATKLALRRGYNTKSLIEEAFNPAFRELGARMRNGDIFITDVLMSSRAMRAALYVIKPFIAEYAGRPKGVIVIGTVAGDLHDIGKDLVAMFLTGGGYNVIDLGIDVTKEAFADAVKNYNPHILALSSLLTTTMTEMNAVIKHLEELGLRSSVKIMIGGSPVTMEFAEVIQADAYSSDLYGAMLAADDLINNRIGEYSVKRNK